DPAAQLHRRARPGLRDGPGHLVLRPAPGSRGARHGARGAGARRARRPEPDCVTGAVSGTGRGGGGGRPVAGRRDPRGALRRRAGRAVARGLRRRGPGSGAVAGVL
ncbi:MAG: hypothetical protein AVDCRST_MAG16-2657, partial [uncultured Frankineae bacterium]